jgi:hypothetical protein
MIHYSSINDAWGNKEIYKNNKESFTQSFTQSNTIPIVPIPIVPINNPAQSTNNQDNVKPIEHFAPTTSTNVQYCSTIEHINNCPECKKKLSEMFKNSDNNREIKIFGMTINLTKDVLKIILIIILILITVNLFSLINVVFQDKPMYLYQPQPAMNTMMKYAYM